MSEIPEVLALLDKTIADQSASEASIKLKPPPFEVLFALGVFLWLVIILEIWELVR